MPWFGWKIVRVLSTSKLVRYFLYATVINFALAIAFTLPVIVPEFTFPLILTDWPGSWMFEAYFAFLVVGVLGNLGWAAFYDLSRRNLGKEEVARYPAFTQLALSNFGVYGATGFMFTVGYRGGYAALIGFGKAVITQSIIGWMVVPIGTFIYFYLFASVVGVGNIVWMFRSSPTGNGPPEQDSTSRDLFFWGALVGIVSLIYFLLPILEMPFYPANAGSELEIQLAAVAGLVTALGIEAYGFSSRRRYRLSDAVPAETNRSL
jgi:hypothetical protein